MVIIKEEPLAHDPTDFSSLKSEVKEANHQDWKHDTVDNAKKRAVTTSRNYDEFKALVTGCTLKPITRHEFNQPPAFKFNVHGKSSMSDEWLRRNHNDENVVISKGLNAIPKVPNNGAEFDRDFRRAKDKEIWLKTIPLDRLQALFQKELDAEMFTKLISVLHAAEDTQFAKEFARRLGDECSKSVQFSLDFLSEAERTRWNELVSSS